MVSFRGRTTDDPCRYMNQLRMCLETLSRPTTKQAFTERYFHQNGCVWTVLFERINRLRAVLLRDIKTQSRASEIFQAARLGQITRGVVGDIGARFAPHVKLLVVRLEVGGDGHETYRSDERADPDRAQRLDSCRARLRRGETQRPQIQRIAFSARVAPAARPTGAVEVYCSII
jgi:hypothetical protein